MWKLDQRDGDDCYRWNGAQRFYLADQVCAARVLDRASLAGQVDHLVGASAKARLQGQLALPQVGDLVRRWFQEDTQIAGLCGTKGFSHRTAFAQYSFSRDT